MGCFAHCMYAGERWFGLAARMFWRVCFVAWLCAGCFWMAAVALGLVFWLLFPLFNAIIMGMAWCSITVLEEWKYLLTVYTRAFALDG